ncbi:MAG: sodium:solute symporter [Crocinitomicaceae bacterium]
MSTTLILFILVAYFLVLVLISFITGKKTDNDTFFKGNRNSRWYIVAFGMIGASLSGVTFISIPGTVATSGYTYLQMCLGYIVGYIIIAFILLPLYYRLNLTSIYEFLRDRFGVYTYKMGAAFFVLSRIIGAALRMYLVANVLQEFVFTNMGVPFEMTVAISILLIWVYTFRGGIKTIIWTDTLQTLFMLVAVGLSVYLIASDLGIGITNIYQEILASDLSETIKSGQMGEMWQTSNSNAKNFWWKGLLGGIFITLGMTGVDQDMMQKNLTVDSLKGAKKNMISLGVILFFVNIIFLTLGGLLFLFIDANPDVMTKWMAHSAEADTDLLFASIALEGGLPLVLGIFFLLGLIAAAYSSADSALTSLTTSVSIDFFNIKEKDQLKQIQIRKWVHIGMSLALLLTIIVFKWIKSDSVVMELFGAANFTYGPLLGLFMFGVLCKRRVTDLYSSLITIGVAVIVFVFIKFYSVAVFGDYVFGSELLGINAMLVFFILYLVSSKKGIING